eukprot:CAMPEP_0201555160 /NCGR_PEP_ID=MMETSP0173_2-20130828/47056_1 /ASSEMBLY_ACC=CAM_ASM_000268 /TAXON_ID=218659 /ORGANISM="Vexillifera sp., Strain DIVA3 564/2" /LENGTH=373 /DNA_ID=CAMNT_0047966811 /DNA_START=42 /DNA_END=1163 /DNA_ORIENTATION=+
MSSENSPPIKIVKAREAYDALQNDTSVLEPLVASSPTVLRDVTEKKHTIRVLITGATGLLGRALMKEFDEYNTVGVGFTRVSEAMLKEETTAKKGRRRYVRCDLTDEKSVDGLLNGFAPHIIVHAAAERRPDVCSKRPDQASAVNVQATQSLCRWASKADDCFLLLISTDYVFDGDHPPYKPSSKPNPVNFYGRSKLDSEKALWKSGHSGGVLRVPVLYGRTKNLDESAVTTLASGVLKAFSSGHEMRVDNWAIRFPTFVDDVAVVCRQLSERRLRHCALSGTWHWSGADQTTKYKMSLMMAQYLIDAKYVDKPTQSLSELIVPINQPPQDGVKRPQNAQLDINVVYLMGMGCQTSFSQGIQIVLDHYFQSKK